MDPARTLGSAVAGAVWDDLWIYFTAPPLAALLAAEVFFRVSSAAGIERARLAHGRDADTFLCAGKRLPAFLGCQRRRDRVIRASRWT